jgi:hypothetical protein
VTFDNNVSFSASASVDIELGGLAAGTQHDKVAVNGALALGGALNVTLVNYFAPQAGNTFDILDWGSLSGTFDTVQLPALAAGLTWNTSQLYTTGVLSVAAAVLLGDYNHNGAVDAADYVLWRKTLGQSGSGLAADGNGNGQIDPGDYNVWRTNFGRRIAPGAATGTVSVDSVPEPASLLLLVSCLITALNIRGRATRLQTGGKHD